MGSKKREWRYATGDFETDPFLENRIPKPFCVGLYDGATKWNYWGDDCVEKFLQHIENMPPTIFYFHNGGRFDFHFLIKYFRGKIRIVNRRILQAKFLHHEFRDSFAILPVPLAKFNKDEIDYNLFERKVREKHKKIILHYMDNDCKYLFEAVKTFIEEFPSGRGPKLTMASAAMSKIKEFHSFDTLDAGTDKLLRPYYYGGRNQCFKTGIIKGDFRLFDVNSMYMDAMKKNLHPLSTPSDFGGNRINKKTYFAKVLGRNYGALPQRLENGHLSFVGDRGEFFASIHELNMGEQTGTFKLEKVLETVEFNRAGNFAEFVDWCYSARMDAVVQEGKNGPHVTLYKLIGNGGYGKFAQDPEKFMDYIITDDEIPEGDNWLPCDELYNYIIWEKKTEEVFGNSYFNVGTGASITGAARSSLLNGISKSKQPLYCDTDSILCRSLDLPQGAELGQWKLECECTIAAIAGKKTYALFAKAKSEIQDIKKEYHRFDGVLYECVKKASKGVRLTASQIVAAAKGETVEYSNPVPNFRLRIGNDETKRVSSGTANFITRKIRRTT